MIQNFRNASQSWIMRGFFAILVAAFVLLWGVGDYFRPGMTQSSSIATVNGEGISASEFVREIQTSKRLMQMRTGQSPNENAARELALQNLVYARLINLEADRMGLVVSDDSLREAILKDPSFKDESGTFNKQLFIANANFLALTEAQFTERYRDEMRQNQLLLAMVGSAKVPESYAQRLTGWQYEKRTIDTAFINSDEMTLSVQPTDADLAEYYNENIDQYKIPEQRDVTVLTVSEDVVKSKLKLTEEEIQQGFQDHKSEIKGSLPTVEETKAIKDILLSEKASRRFYELTPQIEDNLAAGVPLEEIAKTHELQLVSVKGLQRDADTQNKPALAPLTLLKVAVLGFTHDPGDEPGFEQLENGEVVVVRVDDVIPMVTQPLEEVKDKVNTSVIKVKKAIEAQKLAGTLAEEINTGAKLADVAAKNKLKVTKGITIDRMAEDKAEISSQVRFYAFRTGLNKATVAPDKSGFTLVVPQKIIAFDETGKQDQVKSFKDSLETTISSDLIEQFWANLHKQYKPEINRSVLERLRS